MILYAIISLILIQVIATNLLNWALRSKWEWSNLYGSEYFLFILFYIGILISTSYWIITWSKLL